jgi:hypothetical protein
VTGPGGTESPAFDPRHDARFQRGYAPGAGAPAPAGPRLVGGPAAPVVSPAIAAADGDPDVEANSFDDLAFDTEVFQDELEPSRWNPFIALLWAIGLLLLGGALTLQWQAVSSMFSNASYSGTGQVPLEMQLQQLSYMASPSLLTSGLIVIAGLLFWHASAWRVRRRAAPTV